MQEPAEGRRHRATVLPPVLALVGPTAAGKTALAMAHAEQRARDGVAVEIVSVDSALVYRGMDIGTAKPSAAERARVPHHGIDLIEPSEPYSAARFVRDAVHAVEGIRARGAEPLLVGGTMLYVRALRDGLDAMPERDEAVARAIRAEADRRGWPALHAELAEADPATAGRLAPGDAQRIERALSVVRATGRPLSSFHGRSAEPALALDLVAVETDDRAWLSARIAQRTAAMLAAGLVDEVRALRARGDLDASMPSMRCVGYRQAWQWLDAGGDMPGGPTRAALAESIAAATRQLAKRQRTWLRATPHRSIDAQAPRSVQIGQLVRQA